MFSEVGRYVNSRMKQLSRAIGHAGEAGTARPAGSSSAGTTGRPGIAEAFSVYMIPITRVTVYTNNIELVMSNLMLCSQADIDPPNLTSSSGDSVQLATSLSSLSWAYRWKWKRCICK